ncbi:MAG: hypothetical protein UY72_C0011G0010 [Candidatus Uhrbacteria bacterium GW2011_GWD2_52_7]|uniref:Uncharacterized protein n=1 Tax=Candidatus Uhrbacteria bacterium GW2011_GWD2_52_7 TaxID=1618989 RepID=A0A0G1XGU5_9BACT|nr:MAG: hypothetical protein UY72_C0011G0010 [Candidatus Uhrbacteria bacterium GW2011_GWD2_52_7]
MRRPFPRGVTLLETVIYIGLLAITLPYMTSFLLKTQSEHQVFQARTQMEETAGILLSQLSYDISGADDISTSTSTLGTDDSALKFHDDFGTLITIDRPTVAVNFESGSQNVRRLRYQHGNDPAVYITGDAIDVTQWRVVAVRDSTNTLTGVHISLNLAMLNPGTPYRNAAFLADTTLSLQPHTVEN